MSIHRRLSQTITLHLLGAPSGEDDHGNPIETEGATDVPGFISRQAPTQSQEGAVVGEGFRLFLGPQAPLTGWDAVTESGRRYEVIGRPWQVFNPRTARYSHTEADIKEAGTT